MGAVALVCCSTHFTLACSGVDHQVSVWQGLNQLLDNPSGRGAGHTPRKLRPPWFQDPARNLLTIAYRLLFKNTRLSGNKVTACGQISFRKGGWG